MRSRSLALSIAFVVGLFAIPFAVPLPAFAGPTTCPTTGAICIDESVEGTAPGVFFGGVPSGTSVTITAQQPAVGEEWAVVISVPFPSSNEAEVQISSLGLLEPGSQTLSDAIANVGTSIIPNPDRLIMTFDLFSDNDLGQIGISDIGPLIAEDGTFQQLPGTFFITDLSNPGTSTINVFLRSDVEVPEPASLALLGAALAAFGMIRRRRRFAAVEL